MPPIASLGQSTDSKATPVPADGRTGDGTTMDDPAGDELALDDDAGDDDGVSAPQAIRNTARFAASTTRIDLITAATPAIEQIARRRPREPGRIRPTTAPARRHPGRSRRSVAPCRCRPRSHAR